MIPVPLYVLWKNFVSRRRLVISAKFLVIFTIFLIVGLRRLDYDFGWHLKAGDYIREFGVPARDIFTYTAENFHWINHEIGHDVLVSLFYSLGGYNLVAVVFGLLWATAFFIASRRHNLYVLCLAAFAAVPYAGVRPNVWTVLFLAILIRLASKPRPSLRQAGVIALLFAVWANFHGGFILGLATLVFFAVKYRQWRWLAIGAVSVLTSFINPYGPEVYIEIYRTLFDSSLRTRVNEWRHLVVLLPTWPFMGVWLGLLVYSVKFKWQEWFRLSFGLFASFLTATRNAPLFIVAAIAETEEFIYSVKKQLPKKITGARKALLVIFVAAPLLVAAGGAARHLKPWEGKETYFPTGVAQYLRENPCDGNIFNQYNFGGYLIWQAPDAKYYIDGRMPSWQDESGEMYLDRHNKIIDDTKYRQDEFTRYKVTCAVIPSGFGKFIEEQENSGWQLLIDDGVAALLIK